MNVTKDGRRGRGRGSSRGSGGSRGRGKGRGRGFVFKAHDVTTIEDDDDLCNMAFEQFEFQNNSLNKSFEELNTATELDGFDKYSGANWIYPTNRPVRDYQFKMVETALYNNTLVSLPTGLGKTFISAVVMFNYQRWYPRGIIVFMAPTRPLVTQQLDACHNTVGISPSKTIELTGHIVPKKREKLWQQKTVFFLTPQVLLSDLERGFLRAENVRLIVVDEAHKATGNHAYVQVISKIAEATRLFRVLALSATPGSDLAAVQQVFKNLLISRVELRTDSSLDVLPYIHQKAVEKTVVDLGGSYLKSVYDQVMMVFQSYSGKLMKVKALTGRDGYSYTHFQLLTSRETFRKDLAQKLPSYQKGFIEIDFAICMSLAHAMEILLSHGLRTFFIYLQGVLNKEKGSPAVTAELNKNTELQVLLDEIKDKLKISIANSTFEFDLTDTGEAFNQVAGSTLNKTFGGENIEDSIDYTLSHPKLVILKDIVYQHFIKYSTRNDTTRVMIFSQYRDSVQEIGNMLNTLRPLVKPIVFIGQSSTGTTGKGLKQKEQVQVVQKFRDGGFNVLVATCVGEEGLDIGEVDLIICFDASSSPTRLIQRMGRTGRQREGKTIFLISRGKEEEKYRKSFSQHSSISKGIADPKKLEPFLYKFSPRMVPVGVDPTCYKMSILLSTEQKPVPECTHLSDDEDDDEFHEDKNKEKPKKSTKKTVTRKRALQKVSQASPKAVPAKKPILTITKMFDEISNNLSQKSEAQAIIAPEVATDVQYDDYDDEPYDDYLNDFPASIPNQPMAYERNSIFRNIFDMDEKKRTDWKPCAVFSKTTHVLLDDIMDCVHVTAELILLNENELAEVDKNVGSGCSFSANKDGFCECGNSCESRLSLQHGNLRSTQVDDPISTPPVPEVLSRPDSPNLLSDKESEASDDFADEFPLSPVVYSKDVEDCLSSSDFEDSLEFPPSPEFVKPNFLKRLLDQKTNRCINTQPETIQISTHTKNSVSRQTKSQCSFVMNEERIATPNTSSGAAKKFKFKKKDSEQDNNQKPQCSTTPLAVSKAYMKTTPEVHVNPIAPISVVDGIRTSNGHTRPVDDCNEILTSNTTLNRFSNVLGTLNEKLQKAKITSDYGKTHTGIRNFGSSFATSKSEDVVELEVFGGCSKQQESIRKVQPPPIRTDSFYNVPGGHDTRLVPSTTAIQGISPIRRIPFETSMDVFKSPPPVGLRASHFSPFNRYSPASTLNTTASSSKSMLSFIDKAPPPNRRKKNPFIESEAEESGDECERSHDDSDLNEFEGLDDFDDSFVTHDDSFMVSDSQQVRYLESVKDSVPVRLGRVETPLSPKATRAEDDGSGESHYEEDDSICQEEVEYMDVGVFTQAMNAAVVDLALNGSSQGRQTRRAKREALNKAAQRTKQRRRIVVMDDSSDDGF